VASQPGSFDVGYIINTSNLAIKKYLDREKINDGNVNHRNLTNLYHIFGL